MALETFDSASVVGHPTGEARWQARVDLAALYRLFVHFGWTDLTYTHLSARVPEGSDRYLVNPYGLLFDEITASGLVEVDYAGRVWAGGPAYNRAGHFIHTAVLRARPEINFVLHSHTRAAVALSTMRDGLLPLSQPAMVVRETVAYHAFSVAEENEDEARRLVSDLGACHIMVLHNHGLLVCGRTAAEAFLYHYFMQTACEIQTDALRAAYEYPDYVLPPPDASAKLAAWGRPRTKPWGDVQWVALMRLLDRTQPSFRQ